MDEAPGLSNLKALLDAFRASGASSIHIVQVEGDITVFVHGEGDDGTRRVAQSLCLPVPTEHSSKLDTGIRCRWTSTSGVIDGVTVNVSSEHTTVAIEAQVAS